MDVELVRMMDCMKARQMENENNENVTLLEDGTERLAFKVKYNV